MYLKSLQFFKKFQFILVTSLLLVGLFSCGNDKKVDANGLESNLFITGKFTGSSGQRAVLEAVSQSGTIEVSSTTIEDDAFELHTNIPGLGIYQLKIGDNPENVILLTANVNDEIKISGDMKSVPFGSKISGVEWGKDYEKYMTLIAKFSAEQQELMNLQGQLNQEELVKKYLELKKPVDDFALEKINENPGSSFNIVLSNSLMPTMGFIDYPQVNVDALKKMATAYEEKYAASPIARSFSEQVAQIESGYKEYEILKSGNKPAPEIVMQSPEGKEIKLSSLKGKVVLIDFWASWCKPCRVENPNVVKLYNKYKNKGFTVYSVSLDADMAQWVAAIEADGLIWPNHVSDLVGWKTYVTKLYAFQSIPHTVLVGKDGNIIDVGLRGKALEDKVAELLK